MVTARIDLPREELAAFCARWRVRELALFGSVLRDDFRPDSDIDVLARFDVSASWSLIDHVKMQDELATILGRPVDLVTRAGLEGSANAVRKREILDSAQVVYAA
jgi:uncharacterized protein